MGYRLLPLEIASYTTSYVGGFILSEQCSGDCGFLCRNRNVVKQLRLGQRMEERGGGIHTLLLLHLPRSLPLLCHIVLRRKHTNKHPSLRRPRPSVGSHSFSSGVIRVFLVVVDESLDSSSWRVSDISIDRRCIEQWRVTDHWRLWRVTGRK